MARKAVVENWRDHLEKNLKLMAESWSNLAEPAAEIFKQLEATPTDKPFVVTKALRNELARLLKVIKGCPIHRTARLRPCGVPSGRRRPTGGRARN
jgi:hypothetical protein